MQENEVKALLARYRNGLCNPEERQIVEDWMDREMRQGTWDRSAAEREAIGLQMKRRIDQQRNAQARERRAPERLWLTVAAVGAAAVIAVLGVVLGLGLFSNEPHDFASIEATQTQTSSELSDLDVAPGGSRAILQLSDGRTIDLAAIDTGMVVGDAGLHVVKTMDGRLVYQTKEQSAPRTAGAALSHTITTPSGGQYQVVLPDGTQVWLNAGSSLTYPSHFSSSVRVVELSGEAYFEVASSTARAGAPIPFIVRSAGQHIEVLGTHFNVSAYPTDPVATTTLLEGIVRVVQGVSQPAPSETSRSTHGVRSVLLKPGQQAFTSAFHPIEVKTANDIEVDIAWKNGDFKFNGNLENIMQRIARWYDVDVYFEDSFDEHVGFLGKVSRDRPLSSVLKILETSGKVRFKLIEGSFGKKERRVIVMK